LDTPATESAFACIGIQITGALLPFDGWSLSMGVQVLPTHYELALFERC